AARPRDQRRRPRTKEVNPVERVVLVVETNGAALDFVFSDVVAVEVEIERRLELAGMRAAAGELALAPARQEILVHGKQVPPRRDDTLGVGLDIGAARHEIE